MLCTRPPLRVLYWASRVCPRCCNLWSTRTDVWTSDRKSGETLKYQKYLFNIRIGKKKKINSSGRAKNLSIAISKSGQDFSTVSTGVICKNRKRNVVFKCHLKCLTVIASRLITGHQHYCLIFFMYNLNMYFIIIFFHRNLSRRRSIWFWDRWNGCRWSCSPGRCLWVEFLSVDTAAGTFRRTQFARSTPENSCVFARSFCPETNTSSYFTIDNIIVKTIIDHKI